MSRYRPREVKITVFKVMSRFVEKSKPSKKKQKKKVSGYLNRFPRYAPTKTHGGEIGVFGEIFPILCRHGNRLKMNRSEKATTLKKLQLVTTSQNKIWNVLTTTKL